MRRLLSFPNPVNDVAARTVAAGVLVMVLAALALRQPWLTVPLAYGFVARVLSGPRFSPLGQLATRVVAPALPARAKFLPGPPKRFAQGIGAAFTVGALLCWLAGQTLASYILLAFLVVPATLESAFGYCVGCQLFALLMRAGVLPASVCVECGDLWGSAAADRRAARGTAA